MLLEALGGLFHVGNDEIIRNGGVVALLGSTGVGKTTTVAKLAAQYSMRHGPGKVALISTDTLRIGGARQLAHFAKALGVPLSSATSSGELAQKIQDFANYELVLIDTAGISQRDVRLADHLHSIVDARTGIDAYLVVSATSELTLTQEVVDAFHKVALCGAIVTKVDEAATLGPVMSGVIRHNLPVSYICNGQNVPKDIARASKTDLVKCSRQLVYQASKREAQTVDTETAQAG